MKLKKIMILILYLTFLISIIGCNQKNASNINDSPQISESTNTLKLTILNSGKSDCIIISYKDKNIMIDTGTSDNKDLILNYLSDNNINTLDYLILTHYDKDHIGSADKIIKKVNVNKVLEPNYTKDSNDYEDLVKALNMKNLSPSIITSNYTFNIEDAEFTIYPPLKNDYGLDASNEFSLVTSIKHGSNTFLLAGDAQNDRLTELSSQMNLSHKFLKVPHHGETDNNSETFINEVKPEYAVITCSEDEKPGKKLLEYLDAVNTKTYLTYNGTVTTLSDGTNLTVTQ